MSSPYDPAENQDAKTTAWTDDSDATQVVRPSSGSDQRASATGGSQAESERLYSGAHDGGNPMGRAGSMGGAGSGTESAAVRQHSGGDDRADPFPGQSFGDQPYPSRSGTGGPAQSGYGSRQTAHSVSPGSGPGYAPAGRPATFTPSTTVPGPASEAVPDKPASRVGPAFLTALIGLLLTAGGILLLGKFGIAAGTDIARTGAVGVMNAVLATLGAVLLLAAVLLNGWSPWSTVLPGLALAGLGGWALFDAAAGARIWGWTKSLLSNDQVLGWHISGVTLALGLILLGASAAAMMARAGGKRDGQILARRQIRPTN